MVTRTQSSLTTEESPMPPSTPVSTRSPFADGYDIAAERLALKDMVDADDLNDGDPRYARFVELERREALLRQKRSEFSYRDGAERDVDSREANAIKVQLGKLTDEEEDWMFLHTRESSRLFMGRMVEPGAQGYGQSGAKKVGAALRAVWYLSGGDNPYADFALIETNDRLAQMVQDLDQQTRAMEERLGQLRKRGLSFSVLKADPPVKVVLGFRSPYGYAVVNLVSTFDYFVRVVKTMVRKDLLTDKEGYSQIYTATRGCRSVFERVIWLQRYLMKEDLRPLSRSDWLPTSDDSARKRVLAAVALFGELPREVFNGSVMPRHSRRRLDLSDEELRLLDAVPLAGSDGQLDAATAGLV